MAVQSGINAFKNGITSAGTGAGIGGTATIGAFIGVLVQATLQLVGIIFLIFIIYGGFKWMTASGQQKHIEEAQRMITHSIIGLIIVVLAYAISTFVISELQKAI